MHTLLICEKKSVESDRMYVEKVKTEERYMIDVFFFYIYVSMHFKFKVLWQYKNIESDENELWGINFLRLSFESKICI